MKVGDLVCVETGDLSFDERTVISIVGIIVELYASWHPYVKVHIIQTPTGRFLGGQGGQYPFRKSEMRILNESR